MNGDWRTGLIISCILSALLLAATPVYTRDEPPPGFVDANEVIENLVVDMRYYGKNNFVGTRIDGYESPRCLLTEEAAAALARVQNDLAELGLGLKVFDCYRPARAVAHFVRWVEDLDDLATKEIFYPDVDKRDLFRFGYIAERSSHSRGSTVDVTLVRLDGGGELDMGTPFDFFDPESWPDAATVTPERRANRMLLAEAMIHRGFDPYEQEWWHFTLADEPYPDTYFDFLVR